MNPAPPLRSPQKKSVPVWRRRLPLLGGIALIALIVVGLWPSAVPVEVATVSRGPLVVTVDEEGMTRVRNRYVISAPVAGQLRRIDWKAGAIVEAGKTVMATLEPAGADFLDARTQAQARARIHAAEAAREAAAAQRDRATASARTYASDLDRIRKLREEKAVSAQEFDAAQMKADMAAQDVRAAEFGLKVAEFELQQARALLSRSGEDAEPLVISAPVTGRILRVLQESARVVPAGFPLMEVGDPTDLEIRIEVLSRDGVAIAPGAKVLLEQWGGATALDARVRLVEPSAFTKISALGVEEQRVYVVADLIDPIDRRPTLGDSYRVEARIVVWENPNALRVPAGALFQHGGEWQAYLVDRGRAHRKRVPIGRSNGVQTELVGDVAEGAKVIVYPGDKVSDGTRVIPLAIAGR